ncbi:hypothetical protein CABS01_09165 [Colletotrichum abscissum]|uniref:Uncharacterized protein n=1 Tax=Colletotrichum abscissum TaxID=1671311 RepID=A0A9P9X2P6_9PEZI|nr:uncharacterized protein CABS01_09165 [Colletotrichum abscissum]KAI3532728.1 hypothetical protein CABS02_13762 [Colletotrichum abscissum]KAK1503776.1 hypothetical protein CABS01_09165 [Colletotrichum abscissum]
MVPYLSKYLYSTSSKVTKGETDVVQAFAIAQQQQKESKEKERTERARQGRYFQRRTDADAAYPVLRVRGALESLNRGEPRNFAAAVAVTLHHPEKSPLNTTHLRHQYQRLLRSTGDIGSNHTSTARPRPFSTVNTAEPRPRQQPMRIQAHS